MNLMHDQAFVLLSAERIAISDIVRHTWPASTVGAMGAGYNEVRRAVVGKAKRTDESCAFRCVDIGNCGTQAGGTVG